MNNYEENRLEKDEFFKYDPQSPLTAEQKREFEALEYFPVNPDLRLILPLELFEEPEEVEIQTSTGDLRYYYRYGKIRFMVENQPAELTIYSADFGMFLPFVDALAGVETYPAGRYLEPEELPDGKVLVDFNLAYNPYCAYNDRWSCPLTPFENRLKVPLRAGEKIFKQASHD